MLRGWLAHAEGNDDLARQYIGEAMDRAEEYGLIEVFVRGGPEVLQLVSQSPYRPTGFRERVLERGRKSVVPRPGGGLIDPLTDRELEILALMPSRLSNAELAKQCYVSANTIKTHMAHIYRKLEVSNRNEAVKRARDLGLI